MCLSMTKGLSFSFYFITTNLNIYIYIFQKSHVLVTTVLDGTSVKQMRSFKKGPELKRVW
jgi:hypothetical protein